MSGETWPRANAAVQLEPLAAVALLVGSQIAAAAASVSARRAMVVRAFGLRGRGRWMALVGIWRLLSDCRVLSNWA
jgi:hypothetical protein